MGVTNLLENYQATNGDCTDYTCLAPQALHQEPAHRAVLLVLAGMTCLARITFVKYEKFLPKTQTLVLMNRYIRLL
jgi:hypothetical protein